MGNNNTNTSKNEAVGNEKKYKVKKNLDPHTIVPVKNGFQGILVYISRKTGERFIWNAFGDEEELELSELKSAKNSCKKFFINNWFLIDDPEILEYLGVAQYYKYALNYEGFEELFTKTPKQIKDTIAKLSAGQKKTLSYRCKQLIEDGTIDSIKIINALEDSLGIELIER